MGSASARGRDETGSNATEVDESAGLQAQVHGHLSRPRGGASYRNVVTPFDRSSHAARELYQLFGIFAFGSYFSKPLILMTIFIMNTSSMYKRL